MDALCRILADPRGRYKTTMPEDFASIRRSPVLSREERAFQKASQLIYRVLQKVINDFLQMSVNEDSGS